MASYDGSITIKTAVDQTGIKTGIAGISGSLKKLAGTVAVAFGVRAIVNFGKEAINLASDLQEVQNVVDTAFGQMSYKIEEFSKTSIENFGISELSAKSMASTFMAMGTGIGQGMETGSDMAVELTGRLADVMSFYNKSMSEVETIGRSIYSAETESLKQIGIIMTQTNLEAFALSEGYQTLYKDMDAANQLLLRQQFFLANTELAMGDFAKTQDSWANSTRVLSERWNQFLTIIGSRLIQVLTPVVNFLNNMLSAAINVATAISNILGFEAEVSTASSSVGGMASAESDLATSTEEANNALNEQAAAFDKVNVLSSQSGTGSGEIGSSIGGGTSIDYGEASQLSTEISDLQEKLAPLVESIQHLGEALGGFTSLLWEGFTDFFKDLLGIDGLGDEKVSAFIDSLATAIENLDDQDVIDLGYAIGTMVTVLAGLSVGSKAIVGLSNLTGGLNNLATAVGVSVAAIGGFELGKWIGENITGDTEAYKDFGLQEIIDYLTVDTETRTSATKLALEDLANGYDVVSASMALMSTNFESLGGAWIQIGEDIAESVGLSAGEIDNFEHSVYNATQTAKGMILEDGVLASMKYWFDAVAESAIQLALDIPGVQETVASFANTFIDFFNTILSSSQSMVNQMINNINKISYTIPDWVPEIGGKTVGFSIPNVTFSQIPNVSYNNTAPPLPSKSKIPALAMGAVIPPNNRFLAMLGDQTSGVNIESPLSTIVQAMNESLAKTFGTTGAQDLLSSQKFSDSNNNSSATMELDGETFAKVVAPYIINELNRTGTTVKTIER